MSRVTKAVLGVGVLWLAAILINRRPIAGQPLTLPPKPEELLADLQQINATSAGPDDFSAMGEATATLVRVLRAADQLDNVSLTASNLSVDSAVLHLFPFVATRYQQRSFSDLQHHVPGSRGLVIPCGNSDFPVALQLVVAGACCAALFRLSSWTLLAARLQQAFM